jgi:superfamily II DNA/RNA helicase
VPVHAEDYVHRIGRTGRAGREGRSFMLATPEDGCAVAAIVKLIGKEIRPAAIDGIEAAELVYEKYRRRGSRRPSSPEHRRREGNHNAAVQSRPPQEHPPKQNSRRGKPEAPQANVAGPNITPFPRAVAVRNPRQRDREPEHDRKVVGFGDRLPAFLARPPRIVAGP